jgi:hypothetical protein
MRRPDYQSLACLLTTTVALLALLSSPRGWFEYENRNGNRSFLFDTAGTGYTTLHTRDLKYSTAAYPGLQCYRWSYPGEYFFDLQIAHWLVALPIAAAAVFKLGQMLRRPRVDR